jgi:PAS domain S-box-containing protein
MRLATEIQGDSAPYQNHYRGAQNAPHQSHETSSDVSGGPDEISQHLARAAQATNDAVRVWTVGSGALSWPQGLESLLGYTASPATSEIGFWQKQLHPQDRARAAASIRDALATDADNWTGEYRFRHSDGSYLDLLERACIVRDRLGRPVQLIGSLMNITARKQLQDQLVRSQKMEAFGQLAGGVAHDFNNYLTTILGYSDLLLDELGMKGEIAEHIREIRGAAARASALTGQLLAFSRKHPLAPRRRHLRPMRL